MEIQTRSDGTVTSPGLHDGFLVAVEYVSKDSIALRCQSIIGNDSRFLLSQVKAFRADGLLEKNIIFDLTLRKGPKVGKDEITDALQWQGHPLTAGFWSSLMEQLHTGKLVLFQLNPSYGASVGCICQQADLLED